MRQAAVLAFARRSATWKVGSVGQWYRGLALDENAQASNHEGAADDDH